MVTPAQAREIIHEWMFASKPAIETGAKAIDALRDLASQVESLQAELAEKTCQDQGDMTLEQAMNLGKLWSAGKLIGGDAYAAAAVLASHMKSLQADAERIDWLIKNASIGFDLVDDVVMATVMFETPADSLKDFRAAVDEARNQS